MRMGRADRRGAARLAVFVFAAQCLSLVLASHRFWSRDIWMVWGPIAGTGVFFAGMVWICYVALEPYARRVWPSILTSWSRLVSTGSVRIREPQIGSAVLAGLVGACALGLIVPLRNLAALLTETTIMPDVENWSIVFGQRMVLSEILGIAVIAVTNSIGSAFALVLGRSLLRSRLGGVLFLGGVIFLADFKPGSTPTALEAAAVLAMATVYATLLVRFGLIAFAVSTFLNYLRVATATASWTAWHGQPGLIALVVVGLLAAYGFWAASAGGRSPATRWPRPAEADRGT